MALAVVGGGRRCGKSRYALALASAHGQGLAFVATLQPTDQEGVEKVEQARAERGTNFVTFEAQLDLPATVAAQMSAFDAIVVDDLTIWVSNMIMAGHTDETIEAQAEALTAQCRQGPAEVIFVTSDVDFGFPMDGEASRRVRRLAGLINRQAAEAATRLYWMVFGVPKRIR